MNLLRGALMLAIALLLTCTVAYAHFTMIMPGTMDPKASDFMVRPGEAKTFWVLWGHPFEHELFDCPRPEVRVVDPNGGVREVAVSEVEVEGVKAWQFSYRFTDPGDYLICVDLLAADHGIYDHVKAVVHCGGEVWRGWDRVVGQDAEIVPYVRPYGVEEGFVFTGRALFRGEPMAWAEVEVEKYHSRGVAERLVETAEERYQPNPSCMYTRVVKANSAGEFSFTLDEPGVWYVGAYGPAEVVGGHEVQHRAVLQVAVEEAFGAPSTLEGLKGELEELSLRVEGLESRVASLGVMQLAYASIALSIIAVILSIALPLALRRR